MKMTNLLLGRISVFLFLFGTAAFAADPAGVRHWSAAELKKFDQQLRAKLNGKSVATEQFGVLGKNSIGMIIHREADGEAEIHETQNDLFVVQRGTATIVLGGEAQEAKLTAPHEWRGPSIKGGVRKPLRAGDVLYIPAKLPHQLLVKVLD